MEYHPDDLLSALLGQTELIAGVAAGLVVFIVILVIACKCNLFNKVRNDYYVSKGLNWWQFQVRIYKQDGDGGAEDENNAEMENMTPPEW